MHRKRPKLKLVCQLAQAKIVVTNLIESGIHAAGDFQEKV